MKKILILLFAISISNVSMAQQRAQYSQYMQNQFVLNPAVGGTEDFIDAKVGFRAQWLGLEGSPITYYVSVHAPIGKEFGPSHNHRKGEHKGWHGIGMYAYNDVTGSTGRSGALASYTYNMALTKHLRWSIGAFGGFQNFRVDGSSFVLYNQEDQILNGIKSAFVPDLVLGTWLHAEKWYVGVAAHQLLKSQLDFVGVGNLANSSLTNHIFVSAGMSVPVGWDWNIVPSMLVKIASPAMPSVDINGKISYKQGQYFAGFSYRALDSFIALFGTTIQGRLGVSYSFDLTHSALQKYAYGGSHEIVLTWKVPPHPTGVCPSKFWH